MIYVHFIPLYVFVSSLISITLYMRNNKKQQLLKRYVTNILQNTKISIHPVADKQKSKYTYSSKQNNHHLTRKIWVYISGLNLKVVIQIFVISDKLTQRK